MSVDLALREDGIAVITLNRPQALNALNIEMIEQIGARLDQVADSDARALLILGAGGKAFCAGADVKELQSKDSAELRGISARGQATFAKLDRLGIPSVAVISGVAFGGGLEIAMACSFRIASETSRFGLPEIKLGLIPAYGGTQRLPRLIGTAKAIELIVSGRAIDAQEAEKIGLIHKVVHVSDPLEAGLKFISDLCSGYPAALRQAIEAILKAQDLPLEQGLSLEADLFAEVTKSQDAKEGMSAFLQKRKPVFQGL